MNFHTLSVLDIGNCFYSILQKDQKVNNYMIRIIIITLSNKIVII